MKYQLLLKDIAKYTQRADLKSEMEDLRVALQVMHVVPKSANDMMHVGRLQGFDVSFITLLSGEMLQLRQGRDCCPRVT